MSTAQRGLGRGLEALFGDGPPPTTQAPSVLPIDSITPHPQQPRKSFTEAALADLAASICSQGVVQPLLVRPVNSQPEQSEQAGQTGQAVTYELVAGERRWRAARMAGLTEVPVLVREMSDTDVMLTALIENIQREDLTPLEEANALRTIRDQCRLTQEEMAEKLGKSRSSIANALRLLALSPQAQEDIQAGTIQAGHARALLSIPDMEVQEHLRHAVLEKKLNVREAEIAAMKWKRTGVFPWDRAKARLANAQDASAQDASAKDVSVSPDAPAMATTSVMRDVPGIVASPVPDAALASPATPDASHIPSAAPAPPHTPPPAPTVAFDTPPIQSAFQARLTNAVTTNCRIMATVEGDNRCGKVTLIYRNVEEFERVVDILRIHPFIA